MMRPNAVKRGWTELVCDGDECGMVLEPQSSRRAARRIAVKAGWLCSPHGDMCRQCYNKSAQRLLDKVMKT